MEMLTHAVPICTYLLLFVCHGSNLQSLQNAANQTDHAPIGDNNLGQASEMTLLESKRGTLLTKDKISDGHLKSKESTQWDDQTLNKKLMQQKLEEKSKLKTNLNIYTVEESNGVLQDGGNHIVSDFTLQGHPSIQGPQSSSDSSKSSATGSISLFQQIAAISQMRNIHKPNNTRPSTGPHMKAKEIILDEATRPQTVRKAKEIILDEATRPLYGVQSFAEVTPIRLCKRSLPDSIGDKLADDVTGGKVTDDTMTQKDLQHHLDRNEITVNATDKHAHHTKETKGSPRKTYYRRRGQRGHHRGHSMRARHRRSINTDYVSKRGKAVDFITAVKMSPAPPIVRVVPPDPIYYRHGRADEKLFSQSYNRDVQELIRHNVQHYIKSDHLEVTPNGHNDYLNRIEAPRSGRRIVYYATLPEIVRRPSVPLEEYWTNYMIPRELSGSSNQEQGVVKVQSTILDVQDSSKTLIPIKTISPQQASDNPLNRADQTNIQPAPYYEGPYPMRHNRYPPVQPTLPSLRPINYENAQRNPNSNYVNSISNVGNPNSNYVNSISNIGNPNSYANSIPNIVPKQIEIHSPKSYEINGKRYGIYDIPSLGDNAVKPIYDDGRSYNNKFSSYEKFYNVPATFDKPFTDYTEESDADLENDFDWANTRQHQSYSLKFVPQSVTYLPKNVVKTLDTASSASSGSYKNDVVGKHSSNVVHSVTVETSSSNNIMNETLNDSLRNDNDRNNTTANKTE